MFVLSEGRENTCNLYGGATRDSDNIQGIHLGLSRKTFPLVKKTKVLYVYSEVLFETPLYGLP